MCIKRVKWLRYILAIIGVIVFSFGAEAQLLNRLKEKAKDKVGDRIERRLDNKMDQALDTVENKIFKDGATSSGNAGNYQGSQSGGNYNVNININVNGDTSGVQNLGAMMGQLSAMTAAERDEKYAFNKMFKAEITSTDQEEIIYITQYMGDSALMMVFDSEETGRFISDFGNRSMLVFNEEDKTGTAISMDFMEGAMNSIGQDMDALYNEEMLEELQVVCQETKLTKPIAGYVCKNLICENDSARYEAWYTEDISFGFRDEKWGKLSNLFAMNEVMLKMNKIEDGTPLEVVYYDKIEKATATFKVKELDLDIKYIFDTKPYSFSASPF